MDCGIS